MPDRKTVAIFAATPAQKAYLADLARLAGAGQGEQAPDVILGTQGAAMPENISAAQIWFGERAPAEGVRVFGAPVKAAAAISAIRAALQAGRGLPAKIRIGDGELDVRDSLWSRGGETMRLTEKEVAILAYLQAANGKPVSREDLLHHVWSYVREVETHTLETHIYRLRQKIESDPAEPKIIITQGDGYLLPT